MHQAVAGQSQADIRALFQATPGKRREPIFENEDWFKVIDYDPYEQQLVAHEDPARFKVYIAGKRTGKSYWAAREVETLIMTPETMGWIVGVTYDRAEKEFSYLWKDIVQRKTASGKRLPMPTAHYNVRGGNMHVKTGWGSEFRVVSAKDENNLESDALDWFILAEPAMHKLSTWELLRSRVMDRKGIGIFPGTPPNEAHWLKKLFDRGQDPGDVDFASWQISAEDTPYPGREEIAAFRRDVSDMRYRRDVLAQFIGTQDVIFPTFQYADHVTDVCYRADLPLYRTFDFGFTNPWVCLWVQVDQSQDRVYVVDEYYQRGRADSVNIAAVLAHEKKMGYGDVEKSFCDPAGAAARAELRLAGVETIIAGGNSKTRGIELLRKALQVREDGRPGVLWSHRCTNGISEMGLYHNKPGTDDPAKEDDHVPDALRYLYLNLFGKSEPRIWVI